MMPWYRFVLMGLAGLAVGALLARLPWWAAAIVFTGVGIWAVVTFVQLNRDLRRLRRELASLQTQLGGTVD